MRPCLFVLPTSLPPQQIWHLNFPFASSTWRYITMYFSKRNLTLTHTFQMFSVSWKFNSPPTRFATQTVSEWMWENNANSEQIFSSVLRGCLHTFYGKSLSGRCCCFLGLWNIQRVCVCFIAGICKIVWFQAFSCFRKAIVKISTKLKRFSHTVTLAGTNWYLIMWVNEDIMWYIALNRWIEDFSIFHAFKSLIIYWSKRKGANYFCPVFPWS